MIYDERFFEDMNHAIDCYEEIVIPTRSLD